MKPLFLFVILCVISVMVQLLARIPFLQPLFLRLRKKLHPIAAHIRNVWMYATARFFQLLHTNVVYEKFEYLKLKNTSRITGYSDTVIRNPEQDLQAELERYRLKWKRCRTNQERVRYLYGKYVTQNRKQKQPFSYASTPRQLQKAWGEDEYNRLLIPTYYEARYQPTAEIDDEVLEKLRKC